ncbi:DoxX family protein [Saccharopolyspora sp. K220]|uniref:DoxX family protein n=1 Tax=Saccharopolyspora soli TaxID=2926618 RepID=UPI001F56209C|nr:DoxX family protein [Saccharopolyspora soli]MCI2420027.1 DoxX family protein [Saccharopolyspora soli]
MFTAAAIVSALLAGILFLSASGKLTRQESQMATLRKVSVPDDKVWLLAAAEIAGGVGLVVGLFWWPLGLAAAVGVILYFLGAIVAHVRINDWNITAAAVLLVFSAAALTLRILSI